MRTGTLSVFSIIYLVASLAPGTQMNNYDGRRGRREGWQVEALHRGVRGHPKIAQF